MNHNRDSSGAAHSLHCSSAIHCQQQHQWSYAGKSIVQHGTVQLKPTCNTGVISILQSWHSQLCPCASSTALNLLRRVLLSSRTRAVPAWKSRKRKSRRPLPGGAEAWMVGCRLTTLPWTLTALLSSLQMSHMVPECCWSMTTSRWKTMHSWCSDRSAHHACLHNFPMRYGGLMCRSTPCASVYFSTRWDECPTHSSECEISKSLISKMGSGVSALLILLILFAACIFLFVLFSLWFLM